jgi:hypothetical protein
MQQREGMIRMAVEQLTSLQYLAVGLLFTGEKSGREIRDAMVQRGVSLHRTGLCRLMQRLVWQKSVVVRRQERVIGGRVSRECYYRATVSGAERWEQTRAFYSGLPQPPAEFEPAPYVRDATGDREFQQELERFILARLGRAALAAASESSR